jgi:hypothetical protein
MIFPSENYIKGGGVRGYFPKIFCRRFENQIAVSYCKDELNSGIVKVSAIEPILLLWKAKIWIFWFFANFSKTEKCR